MNKAIIPVNVELEEVQDGQLLTTQYGDIASGVIRIAYQTDIGIEVMYEVKYDTKAGPDGLNLVVDNEAGDEVIGEVSEDSHYLSVPKKVIIDAQMLLSKNHYEAVREMNKHIYIFDKDEMEYMINDD